MFFEEMSKMGETSTGKGDWDTASAKTTDSAVNVANIDKFARGKDTKSRLISRIALACVPPVK